MNTKTLTAMAVAATLSTGIITTVAQPALAADSHAVTSSGKTAKESSKNRIAEDDLAKVSNDAMIAMRNINNARLAIFDGEPDEAQTYIDAATTRIHATEKDAAKYAVDTKQKKKPNDTYVVYDETLIVDDKYVPTEKKAKHIANADKHIHHGNKSAAIEEMKLANIAVSIDMHLVPVKFAEHEISTASKLVDSGKYYEANLALKSVQDSVISEIVSSEGKPKSGAHS
jgi:hypothetical protein